MNTDTGEYRRLADGEPPQPNEVLVVGTDEQLSKLSRSIRRGLRHTDPSLSLEERVAKLEESEAERDRQVRMRARATACGLVLP